jgi:hypothetical protein
MRLRRHGAFEQTWGTTAAITGERCTRKRKWALNCASLTIGPQASSMQPVAGTSALWLTVPLAVPWNFKCGGTAPHQERAAVTFRAV